jgi:hypothetical protein
MKKHLSHTEAHYAKMAYLICTDGKPPVTGYRKPDAPIAPIQEPCPARPIKLPKDQMEFEGFGLGV